MNKFKQVSMAPPSPGGGAGPGLKGVPGLMSRGPVQ